MNDICIIGHPSKLGGADTELDHQIYVWQALGLKVHILHTGQIDSNLKVMHMEERGCIIHEPRKWSDCKNMVCISYCNGEFLKNIREVKQYAKSIIWVNCMCWAFDKERESISEGLIDWCLYQTEHGQKKLQEALNPLKFKSHVLPPYFHADGFPFMASRPADKFRFCRISREDQDKFNKSQFWIYETMTAPVLKEGVVLGFNDTIQSKIGLPPNWIKCYRAGAVDVHEVYKNADYFIMAADTYENLPRVGFEAMASGCVLIVDNRGGWCELVSHKQTGFLCNNEREFVYYASRAAFEPTECSLFRSNARDLLTTNWGMKKSIDRWAEFFSLVDK